MNLETIINHISDYVINNKLNLSARGAIKRMVINNKNSIELALNYVSFKELTTLLNKSLHEKNSKIQSINYNYLIRVYTKIKGDKSHNKAKTNLISQPATLKYEQILSSGANEDDYHPIFSLPEYASIGRVAKDKIIKHNFSLEDIKSLKIEYAGSADVLLKLNKLIEKKQEESSLLGELTRELNN